MSDIDTSREAVERLIEQSAMGMAFHSTIEATLESLLTRAEAIERERDEAREEAERFKKLDREAATYVETVICMRTGFTGDPPYVGWKGLGLALTEALNERDALRAQMAWRPIETAPRDGTHILLFVGPFTWEGGGWTAAVQTTGYWDTIDNAWCPTVSTWVGPFVKPTHWRPLPNAPEAPMTDAKLLPCPFCGSHEVRDGSALCSCAICGAQAAPSAWNRRAALDASSGEPLSIGYVNYRGEFAMRRIIPRALRFGSTEWHPEPQWLLLAFDVEKQAEREFALKDFRTPPAVTEAMVEAADVRCMFVNPETFDQAADEIDCAGSCEHLWREWDTNASGCRKSEAGEYCPNDLAETLRAIGRVAKAAQAQRTGDK